MDINQTPSSFMALPTADEANTALNNARLKAAIGFEFMVETLTIRGFEPSITTKGLLEISDHLYKVSGMALKQTAQVVMPTIKFSFNAEAPKGKASQVVTIDMEQDPLDNMPEYIKSNPIFSNVLTVDLDEELE